MLHNVLYSSIHEMLLNRHVPNEWVALGRLNLIALRRVTRNTRTLDSLKCTSFYPESAAVLRRNTPLWLEMSYQLFAYLSQNVNAETFTRDQAGILKRPRHFGIPR